MANSETLSQSYPAAGKVVVLTVYIGNNQLGVSNVLGDGAQIAQGQSINHQPIPAGTKILKIRSIVSASNPNTSDLVVTYVLDGGTQGMRTFTSSAQAQNQDTWEFDTTFNLA